MNYTLSSNEQTVATALTEGRKQRGSKFLVLIPTYNEIENIADLVERLLSDVNVPIEILVIDDNSPDGTAEAVMELCRLHPSVSLLNRPGKAGLGAAYLAGYRVGFAADFPFFITMDADLSHDPVVINRMVKEIEDYDLVIGSRFVRGGGIVDIQVSRILISRLGNLVTDKLLGMPYQDCTSGYRCYRAEMLAVYDLEKQIKARRYVFLVELLLLLHTDKYKIKEVPIIFLNRLKGETKVNWREMVHALKIIFFLTVGRIFSRK